MKTQNKKDNISCEYFNNEMKKMKTQNKKTELETELKTEIVKVKKAYAAFENISSEYFNNEMRTALDELRSLEYKLTERLNKT